MRILISLLFFFLVCTPRSINAQTDTIYLKKGDMVTGELKSMDRSVVVLETSYSKSDFKIKWAEVEKLATGHSYIVRLKNGLVLNGTISYAEEGDRFHVRQANGEVYACKSKDIVYLKELFDSFWSRLNANIDLGLNVAKANQLRQYNTQALVGYQANKWRVDISYSGLRSRQDSATKTKRSEGNISGTYLLQHNWFVASNIKLLSNTEQALALRATGGLGAGKYLVQTSRSYFGVGGGLSVNLENFSNDTEGRQSLEAYAALEWNLYDVKNISLLSKATLYRSLTESGRWRCDANFDAKFDLPLDFYIKPGMTLNFDNQPAIAGRETDYVIYLSFGWEL